MCYNATVSIIAFVVGTLLNILTVALIPKPAVIAVSIVWEWALLMQLFDFFLWKTQNEPCTDAMFGNAKWKTTGAFVANILQPFIAFIAIILIAGSEVSTSAKIAATMLFVGYVVYMLGATSQMKPLGCVKAGCSPSNSGEVCPQGGCSAPCSDNLNYSWWNHLSGLVYLVVLVGVVLLLLRPFSFALMQSAFILITLFIAMLSVKGTVPSVWCLLAASAPFFTIGFWKWSERLGW